MNINDLSGEAKSRLLDALSTTTAAKPATRQTLAVAAQVERAEVAELLSVLRLQGYLILEDERGCWLAESYAQYEEWYNTALIPTMVTLLQIAQVGKRAALAQFKTQAETG